jgi:hypothetical protein
VIKSTYFRRRGRENRFTVLSAVTYSSCGQCPGYLNKNQMLTWPSATPDPQRGNNVLEQTVAREMARWGGFASGHPQYPHRTSLDLFLCGFLKHEICLTSVPVTLSNFVDFVRTTMQSLNILLGQMSGTKFSTVLMSARQKN